MTEEEIKNKISEHKECCKKLAEEYRQRYNENNADKLALNMFYHNVISFNDFEIILATIEDRNSMMMCFSEPPYLTEETVEVNIKRIAELEKENVELIGKVAFLENDLNNAKSQIEKLIDFVLPKTECCDVCPITDTCINSEGTCPYVGILAKGEEEVTREWLMQFISRR